ncbi:hypothetical protein [Brevundimonas aveniformis]|uniref:hypothetical protein n=1 Tax=Brevundimonas aveniformis TaxID=370977 RepID=UPI00041C66EA|nr:hypothetical protein [Brevundimonas aveniformis]
MQPKPRTSYRHVGLTTWHLIRHAYLSGASAPTVAARYGVSVSALRKRAAAEGWTKRDWCRSQSQPPSTAWDPARDESGAALAEAAALPGAAGDPLVRPPTDAEAAFVRNLWPIPDLKAGVLARKALALADQALRQGRALDARRFADAARTIADLDDLLPWIEDRHDPDAAAARGDMMRDFIQEHAVELALQLHRGEPLDPRYDVMVERFHAGRAATEEKAGDDV